MAIGSRMAVDAAKAVGAPEAVCAVAGAFMGRRPSFRLREPVAIGRSTMTQAHGRSILKPIFRLVGTREILHNPLHHIAQRESFRPKMKVRLGFALTADRDVVDLIRLKDPFQKPVASCIVGLRKQSATAETDDAGLGKRDGDIHANDFPG